MEQVAKPRQLQVAKGNGKKISLTAKGATSGVLVPANEEFEVLYGSIQTSIYTHRSYKYDWIEAWPTKEQTFAFCKKIQLLADTFCSWIVGTGWMPRNDHLEYTRKYVPYPNPAPELRYKQKDDISWHNACKKSKAYDSLIFRRPVCSSSLWVLNYIQKFLRQLVHQALHAHQAPNVNFIHVPFFCYASSPGWSLCILV